MYICGVYSILLHFSLGLISVVCILLMIDVGSNNKFFLLINVFEGISHVLKEFVQNNDIYRINEYRGLIYIYNVC